MKHKIETPAAQNSEAHKNHEHHHFFKVKSWKNASNHEAASKAVDNLWVKCPKCKELTYIKEHLDNLKVCQKCRYHHRLNARDRINFLLDENSFVEINAHLTAADPLQFASDGEIYPEKIKQSQRKTNLNESLITGYGAIEGQNIGIAVADFSFLGASMGSVFGEKLVRLINFCLENRYPVVTVSASGGARMHEGLFSLMQMAKVTVALARLGKARLPHISILTDPCYGGVTASYASVADVILAEPGAMVGFAGPRVIEQTTRQKLPAGFQTAEFLLEHGIIDRVTPRRDLRHELATFAKLLGRSAAPAQSRPILTMKMPHHDGQLSIAS
jgi:acetyl-CoA carboxylase carboxyl transferase subunit beta